MVKIKTENIEIGMVLSEDVTLGTQTILVKGAIIKNKHMNIFKSWGVTAIDVDSMVNGKKIFSTTPEFHSSRLSASSFSKNVASVPVAETEIDAEKKEREKKLKERFFHVDLSFGPANILYEYCFLH